MTDQKRAILKRLLQTHSVPDAVEIINRNIAGEMITKSQAETIRRGMVARGEVGVRERITERPGPILKPHVEPIEIDKGANKRILSDRMASDALHKATVAYFQREAKARGRKDWWKLGTEIQHGIAA